jgi:hypothetical protein
MITNKTARSKFLEIPRYSSLSCDVLYSTSRRPKGILVKVRCRKYFCQFTATRPDTKEASSTHTVKTSVKQSEQCYLIPRETARSSFGLTPSQIPPPLIYSFTTGDKGNIHNPDTSAMTRCATPTPADVIMLRERRGGLPMTVDCEI